jgi:hypothetical protein
VRGSMPEKPHCYSGRYANVDPAKCLVASITVTPMPKE